MSSLHKSDNIEFYSFQHCNMISSNHRKPRTDQASPPSPQGLPYESLWQPPASITIPILIVNFDESLNRALPSALKTNNKDIRKNTSSIDENIFHHEKLNDNIIIDASPIDDSSIFSENFTKILNEAERITKDADTMLKLIKMTKDDIDSSLTSAVDSYPQEVNSWRRESLDDEQEGLTYFSGDDSSMSSVGIRSPAFELLEMLYGRDSFRLTQDRVSRRKKTSTRDAPVNAIVDGQLVSNRQLAAPFATESRCMDAIDPTCFEDCSQPKNNSSSPRDLVLSRQNYFENKSRDVEIGRGSPLHQRQLNTRSHSNSVFPADYHCGQRVRNKPPRFCDTPIISRNCDMGFDSSEIFNLSLQRQHPRNIELRRQDKDISSPVKRTCAESMVNKPKVVPRPPPHLKLYSTPLPLLNTHSSNNNTNADRNSDVSVHCLTGSYDDMMSLAQRMSSNRSLGEPSILEHTIENQHRKKLRGRPMNKMHMRGRGRSAEKSKSSRHINDSCGEMSGAETSQTSRKSINSRLVASRLRKSDHEKWKKQRAQEKSKPLNVRPRSLDRLYWHGRHRQCKGSVAARIVTKKKSGIAGLLQDRLACSLGRSATGSTGIISGSLSTTDSRTTRTSQSWDCRKSVQSRPSKKPTKASLSPKMRIVRRSSILSAGADGFKHQCIQVNVNDTAMFDVESCWNSSLSCSAKDKSY